MIKKVDHIAIAVKNLEEAASVFENIIGLKVSHIQEVPDQGVRIAMINVNGVEIELLEPMKPDTGVAKFLEKNGEGLHHICLEVDDVNKELDSLASKGINLIDKQGKKGAAGLVGFLHPKSTKGVLIELAQK